MFTSLYICTSGRGKVEVVSARINKKPCDLDTRKEMVNIPNKI